MNDKDKTVDYSLIVEVALDSLCTRLVRDTFLRSSWQYHWQIMNDASCCLMREKIIDEAEFQRGSGFHE